MARLRPALAGVLILLLAALLGQSAPLMGEKGLAANPVGAIEAGETPFAAFFAAAVQFGDDTDDDPPVLAAIGERRAPRSAPWWHGGPQRDVTTHRVRPRSTGPPATIEA